MPAEFPCPRSPAARARRAVLLLSAVLAFGACALTRQPAGTIVPELALMITDSPLLPLVGQAATGRGEQSGFDLLDTGRDALLARAAMVEAARFSLDAQYYIWNSDDSGRYLASRLFAAAERGVRVRILLDDINVGERAGLLAWLDQHPRIEVRIYNPFAQRRGLLKLVNLAWEFARLNRRMHNKSMTVDGALTVVGGRNIGDEYFDAHVHLNFRDRDVLAAGPVVAQTEAMFNTFWSSPLARPVAEVAGVAAQVNTGAALARSEAAGARLAALHGALPDTPAAGYEVLGARVAGMSWAPARLVFDAPPADGAFADTSEPQRSVRALATVARAATRELLIESAYLVMDEATLEGMRTLRERGVAVRALTNSLASNDVTANHAAYARRRGAMLAGGMEISELRPDAASCARLVLNPAACGEQHVFGLHAKTFVFDRHTVYVGSLNLNLRSRYLNAESGMVIESPELAARIARDIEENMAPANSWWLVLEERGALRWQERAADGSVTAVLTHDPRTTWARRMAAGAIAALPLEKYL